MNEKRKPMKKELYVGSISARATEEDIRHLFSISGTVTSIHLIRDAQTGEFKGCGYVRMATPEQTKDAVETLDGALLIDKVLTVSIARPQPPQKKQFGGGRREPGQERRPRGGKR
jgi:RNA recognition motif-containing protein